MTQSEQTIIRSGSKASVKGPDTASPGLCTHSLFQAQDPGRAGGAIVTFEPSARTFWHTHPLGQVLVVLTGLDGRSVKAGRELKSALETSFPVAAASVIGMGQRLPQQCRI